MNISQMNYNGNIYNYKHYLIYKMDHITNDNIILFEMEMYIKQINDLKDENKELKRIVKLQEKIWFSQEDLIQSLLDLSKNEINFN